MIAFFCATPYQVFNSLNAKFTILKEEPADIFIGNSFLLAKIFADNLRELNIFRYVFFVDIRDSAVASATRYRIMKFCSPHLIKKFIPNNILKSLNYNSIFAFGNDIMSANFFWYFKNKNKHIEFSFIDEGIGSYAINPDALSPKVKWVHDHLMINIYSVGCTKDIYLYAPEIATIKTNISLRQLPKISRNHTELINTINRVFGYSEEFYEPYINKKYIYFDQPLLDTENIETDNGLNFLSVITKYIDKNEIIVKVHPRRGKVFYSDYGYDVATKIGIPFELLMLNHSFEDKILISEMSTATLSPKLIFNDEPKVCITYKQDLRSKEAYKQDTYRMFQSQYECIFENCRRSYSNCEDFMIAETENDIKEWFLAHS